MLGHCRLLLRMPHPLALPVELPSQTFGDQLLTLELKFMLVNPS